MNEIINNNPVEIYQINGFHCPHCGGVNESDSEFETVEECVDCGEKVTLR